MTALEAVAVVEEFLEGELEHRQDSMLPPEDPYIANAEGALAAIAVIRKTVNMPAIPVLLARYSLEGIEKAFRQGIVSQEGLDAYLLAWNAVPGRFTHAYWQDGAIRQRDRT